MVTLFELYIRSPPSRSQVRTTGLHPVVTTSLVECLHSTSAKCPHLLLDPREVSIDRLLLQ
jgi:hypothetical protein